MYHDSCPCSQQTDALVSADRQQLCQIYEPDQALCRGTLFPELDKPLAGVKNTCAACVTPEHMHDFAAWELRLYLNMNPCDQKALKLYRQFCRRLNGRGYACVDGCAPVQNARVKPCCDNDISFARAVRTDKDDPFVRVGSPIREKDACASCEDDGEARWTWVDQPWPWEKTANHRKEG